MDKRKIICIVCAVGILFVLLVFLYLGGIIMQNGGEQEAVQNVQYVIVLGCKLEGEEPGRCLAARIERATDFLLKNPEVIAVCSGGQGSDEEIPEGEAIRRGLIDHGIANERILVENQSKSTYENFIFSKKIIDEREQGNTYKIAFVTNDFHLYRSRRLAKYVGFTAIGLCAPTPRDILLPNLIREVCSVIVSCIRFRT